MSDQKYRSESEAGGRRPARRNSQKTKDSRHWTGAKDEGSDPPEPDAQAEWAKTQAQILAGRYGAYSYEEGVERLEPSLTKVVAAVQQTTNKRARQIVTVVATKAGATAAIGGITGLISMFGTASTGTAISTLSGAAATSAQLYWVGSLVGLGAAGGGLILSTGGLALGGVGVYAARRKYYGRPRSHNDLQDHERALLDSCATLLKALQEQETSNEKPSASEMAIVAEQVLIPLVHHIDLHWDNQSIADAGVKGVQPLSETLAPASLRKLRSARKEVSRIAVGVME